MIDRVVIQGWQRKEPWGLEQWVTVELHGDDIVFEKTIDPAKWHGEAREGAEKYPNLFKSQHKTYKEYELRLIRKTWTA